MAQRRREETVPAAAAMPAKIAMSMTRMASGATPHATPRIRCTSSAAHESTTSPAMRRPTALASRRFRKATMGTAATNKMRAEIPISSRPLRAPASPSV